MTYKLSYFRKFVLLFVVTFAGCSAVNTTTDIQDIVELQWQADGSALYGFIQKTTITSYDTYYPQALYNIVKFNTDGSVQKIFSTDQKAVNDFSYSQYISADGSNIVTQLGIDLYEFNTNSGAQTKITSQFHLIVASPDLHYVVGSYSPATRPIKTLTVLDVSKSPFRIIKEFDVASVFPAPGVWLSDNNFGITITDSMGYHIAIFDTTGSNTLTIGGAKATFHNTKYFPTTKTLYFQNFATRANDNTVDKYNFTTKLRATAIAASIESFDITKDEGMVAYTYYRLNTDSSYTRQLIFKNLESLQEKVVATDNLSIVSLSPNGDKLAYVQKRDVNFNQLSVIPVIRP